MAGPATTGNIFVLNNMQGTPLPLGAAATLQPQEEVQIWMQLAMDPGMDGPHHFVLHAAVTGEGGESYPPIELHVKGVFG